MTISHLEASWVGQISPKNDNFSKIYYSTPIHVWKKNECLVMIYQNFEIQGTWVSGSCPRSGPMRTYSENVFSLRKYLHPQQWR